MWRVEASLRWRKYSNVTPGQFPVFGGGGDSSRLYTSGTLQRTKYHRKYNVPLLIELTLLSPGYFACFIIATPLPNESIKKCCLQQRNRKNQAHRRLLLRATATLGRMRQQKLTTHHLPTRYPNVFLRFFMSTHEALRGTPAVGPEGPGKAEPAQRIYTRTQCVYLLLS